MQSVRYLVRYVGSPRGSKAVPGFYSWPGRFSVIVEALVEALCDEVRER